MSKIGSQPIQFNDDVEITINKEHIIIVKGLKGILELPVHQNIKICQTDHKIILEKKQSDKFTNSLHGLTQRLISNTIKGVTEGFSKKLALQGVGYRVTLNNDKLSFNVGFSHPVEVKAPANITFLVEKNTITVVGIDKQLVGQVAASIRNIKPPEPYKGKGIRYLDEVVKRKAGKTAKAAGAPGATA